MIAVVIRLFSPKLAMLLDMTLLLSQKCTRDLFDSESEPSFRVAKILVREIYVRTITVTFSDGNSVGMGQIVLSLSQKRRLRRERKKRLSKSLDLNDFAVPLYNYSFSGKI